MKLPLKSIKEILKGFSSRPAFQFQVEWGKFTATFQEVSGITTASDPKAYKEGGFAHVQRPGLSKFSTITLRHGIISSAQGASLLKLKIHSSEQEREDLLLRLIDEKRRHVAAWKISAARPTKVQYSELKADGNEVAIESVELTHEGLCIQKD